MGTYFSRSLSGNLLFLLVNRGARRLWNGGNFRLKIWIVEQCLTPFSRVWKRDQGGEVLQSHMCHSAPLSCLDFLLRLPRIAQTD